MNSHSFASTLLSISLVALLISGAFAHTYLSGLILDGTHLAEGDCVRPHPALAYDNPISLLSSPDMTCGFLPEAAQPANRACPIAAGSTMGVQWHHSSDQPGDDIMSTTHVGPIMFYLAKSSDGQGPVWFKIWEDGYDATTGKWATDKMIAAGGVNTFTIPADIAPGKYLLRAEVLALHNAYALNGVQPYVGCAELTISGTGSANPSGVAFPGAYNPADLVYNIYVPVLPPFTIPGPAVYVAGSVSASTPAPATSAPATPVPTTRAPVPVTNAPSTPAPETYAPATYAPATYAPATPAPATPAPATPAPYTPTYAPATPAPSAPVGGAGSLTVQMNGGSSTWWLGVIVSGGSQATVAVEIMDSESVSSWTQLQQLSYAYVFDRSIQLTLPISVRLTSASGAQVTLTNIFASWAATAAINTGKDYISSSSPSTPTTHAPATPAPATYAPATSAPATPAPATYAPATPAPATPAPATSSPASPATPAPYSDGVSFSFYPGSSVWWLGLNVNGMENVASVEVKDMGTLATYALMTYNDWGYSLTTQGQAFVPPLTVRITDETGRSATAVVASIVPGDVNSAW